MKDLTFKHEGEIWRCNVRAYIIDLNKNFLIVSIPAHIGPKWEIVGGGIEIGESPIQALRREIFEEVGFKQYSILFESKEFIYERFDPIIKEKLSFDFIGLRITEFIVQVKKIKPEIKPQTSEVGESLWVPYGQCQNYLTYRGQMEKVSSIIEKARLDL